jgi:hypothetical protein
MVTPGGSRPAALTQAQVDDLVRGSGDAGHVLRATRRDSAARADDAIESGSRPVDLSAEDIEAMRGSAEAPSALRERIANSGPPKQTAARTRGVATGRGSSMPTEAPPQQASLSQRPSD